MVLEVNSSGGFFEGGGKSRSETSGWLETEDDESSVFIFFWTGELTSGVCVHVESRSFTQSERGPISKWFETASAGPS
jgi:hypothetical protein